MKMKYIKPALSVIIIVAGIAHVVMVYIQYQVGWVGTFIGDFWSSMTAVAGLLGLISCAIDKLTGASIFLSVLAAVHMIFTVLSCLVYSVSISLAIYEIITAILLVAFIVAALKQVK